MKSKIFIICMLSITIFCEYFINNSIKTKYNQINNKIYVNKINNKPSDIKYSEVLSIIEKYEKLEVEDMRFNNNSKAIDVTVALNDDLSNASNIINALKREKSLVEVRNISVKKSNLGMITQIMLTFMKN
ncbi:hypothetical protein [Clostridium hydrogenum]|uniref:hypothetical protein n=1 Tax=Clostridium hydrogenum TaxID=2855764 RepID=UPI001F2B921F|nr:hypothetical protein [Clostridium hydrogenum]